MADASDSQLLTAWRGGDQAAGEALFARHFASIARFFRNKTHGDIEELIQRTFLGCLEGQQRFSGEGSFRGFLFGIARNVLYNHLRTNHRHGQPLDLDEVSLCELGPTASAVVAKEQEEQLLLDALFRLPLAHQLVIELFYWEELSLAEIAEALGVPVGTAATRLRRARQLLEEQMAMLTSSQAVRERIPFGFETWARNLRDQQ
ncbi:RNA polymerase sigma factor [Nannocystis punicea]|uniref:RNA polymerase sigma factor n=1 Tax=Nannocystis punicea TaxID=2995304 RepID=A0ABY7HB22_9BACT|nr:RNA polymerase sigma factor [Nannocystis poenicansa]WAS96442.1 RNA polymerase sigma factor [Nannocystis poenicansa]